MEALKNLLRFLEEWGIGLGEKLVIISITHSQISSDPEACLFLSPLCSRNGSQSPLTYKALDTKDVHRKS